MIELKEIVKKYTFGDSELLALDHVNLTINKGEMVAVMGASGSGKSTLLNVIGCMDGFDSGEYLLDGNLVNQLNKHKIDEVRKKYISMIFQNFALLNHNTVYENIEVPLIARGIGKRERKEMIEDVLKKFSIEDLANKLPTKISGGQQQRCAIARAVVSECEIILADEPTGALDSITSDNIMDILYNLKNMQKTIVIVTHDINVAKKCERIIFIEDGKVKES